MERHNAAFGRERDTMSSERATVIIPAHNEESVIARTLRALLRKHGGSADFGVIVVCNGCTDRTADLVREEFPGFTVLELAEGSKIAALNAGLDAAPPGPVLLLDADIELDTCAAHALLAAARRPGIEAAIGRMQIDTTGADRLVRSFYSVWLEHPYLRNGKFAAVIALSVGGRARVGTLPTVIADDTYLRRLIPRDRVALVESAQFLVRVPRKIATLVRVRSRSHRGTRQLAAHAFPESAKQGAEAWGLVMNVGLRPSLWFAAPVYVGVAIAARLLSRLNPGERWERDQTSRVAAGDVS
jgi:glycosyltransferase involved in cell wall biosynthesis